MIHYASPELWSCYRRLPAEVKALADKSFELLQSNAHHPSLHHKKVRDFHSVRVGLFYRALGILRCASTAPLNSFVRHYG